MKFIERADDFFINRRSPCGERGLKYKPKVAQFNFYGSLPVRGAWIEMQNLLVLISVNRGRSPCGERGLKSLPGFSRSCSAAVAPRAGSVD